MKITFTKVRSGYKGKQPQSYTCRFLHRDATHREFYLSKSPECAKWWGGGQTLFGKIWGLPYIGREWFVHVDIGSDGLKTGLENYIEHNPEGALDLLAEMLPKAVEKLKKKSEG